ncbi:hypothetical protein BLNAU_5846 [Blattamonas nauphoetae]|uniref:Uncharacterized protein n=1 Tax=Blattamonas nauphoetae TaxID=2049346 RepID=A0ABQ9Y6G4_9EUKA|nr:hypothetical protein BLNAU_5846 [Blattamonas nauphoetae]
MESVHFRNGMLNKISNGIHPNYLDLGMMSNKETSNTTQPVLATHAVESSSLLPNSRLRDFFRLFVSTLSIPLIALFFSLPSGQTGVTHARCVPTLRAR